MLIKDRSGPRCLRVIINTEQGDPGCQAQLEQAMTRARAQGPRGIVHQITGEAGASLSMSQPLN